MAEGQGGEGVWRGALFPFRDGGGRLEVWEPEGGAGGNSPAKCRWRRRLGAGGTRAERRNRAAGWGWLFFREKKTPKAGAEH